MRKIISSLLALMLVFSLSMTAFAAGGTVTYDGKAQEFIFTPGSSHSVTDLFTEFKDVMPGDYLSDSIVINNTRLFSKHIKVYMRAKGAVENADFLNQMNLTVTRSGGNPVFFDAPADQKAQLTNWVYLGTVYSRGKITLDLELEVPITMGNDYQEKIGELEWEFKVEEIPHDPDSPKTGDYILTVVAVMAVAAAGLVVLLVVGKRRKKNKQ